MANQRAYAIYLFRVFVRFAAHFSLSWSLRCTEFARSSSWPLVLKFPMLWVVLFQGLPAAGNCQTDQASSDTVQASSKSIRNTIYAGVGGFGPPVSLNYEVSWGAGEKVWGLALGGYFRNASEGSLAPMSSLHTWHVHLNRMPRTRAGFEYGAGFIYSSGMEASEDDRGYPQRLFLGVKPACLRIQFNPRGVMIRLYGIGLITLHEFNAEWRKKIAERDDPRVFGNAWKFPISALWALEVGYTF